MTRNYLITLIAILQFIPIPGRAAGDVGHGLIEPGKGVWSIGLGIRGVTYPYAGMNADVDYYPLINYSGERFFIDGTRTGFHLFNNEAR